MYLLLLLPDFQDPVGRRSGHNATTQGETDTRDQVGVSISTVLEGEIRAAVGVNVGRLP